MGEDSFYKKTIRGNRTDHLLWQKERLLTMLADDVVSKTDYKYLAWVDADVLFQNPTWVKDACDKLEDYMVIQTFDSASLLDHDLNVKQIPEEYYGLPQRHLSAIKYWELTGSDTQRPVNLGGPPKSQCGFAWASCREFFEQLGMEERNVFGDSDSFMLAALTGGEPFFNVHIHNCMGPGTVSAFNDYKDSLRKLASDLGKDLVSCSKGALYHLQHGSLAGKQYVDRLTMIREGRYDCFMDIQKDKNGLFSLTDSATPKLRENLIKYFNDREEDQFINNYELLETTKL